MKAYSVLMSVYYKEKAEYFRESIDSMLNQTILTDDFVIVCDGPLNQELDEVINEYTQKYPNLFNIIRLPENKGIGYAASEGLKVCKHDLVAKMDSDDISFPQRCEVQLKEFEKDESLSAVGTQLSEFVNNIDNVIAIRRVPTQYLDIIKYARRRSPLNNQTVMYKKSAVNKVGGYNHLCRCEDYELFIRMLHNGQKIINLDEVYVSFRLTSDAYKRRSMWNNTRSFVSVRWKSFRMGYSSIFDFLIACTGQLILVILPKSMSNFFYTKFLRN